MGFQIAMKVRVRGGTTVSTPERAGGGVPCSCVTAI